MKNHYRSALAVTMILLSLVAFKVNAQDKILFNGSLYTNNSSVYLPCNSASPVSARVEIDGVGGRQYAIINSASVQPAGWSYTLSQVGSFNSQINFTVNSNGGTLTVNYQQQGGSGSTITISLVRVSTVNFTSTPALNGGNQSATYEISTDNSVDSYSWITTAGLRVNGSTSYTSSGGFGASATISTLSTGGNLSVRANSTSCGSGPTNSIDVGPTYISSATVDGQPYGGGTVYVSSSAYLVVNTNASSVSWSILNGTGYIYPALNSCNASPNPFIRVFAETSASYGTSDSRTFYIMLQGYSGYSMAYPNPTTEKLKVDFDDAQMASDLLHGFGLYSKSAELVRSFNVEQAKTTKYFQNTKSIELDLKGLVPGIYYLKVKMGDRTFANQISVK